VAVIMATSILAIVYIGRLLLAAYFQSPPEIGGEVVAKNEAPLMMLIPMWGLALLSVAIGINADLVVTAGERASVLLLGGGG